MKHVLASSIPVSMLVMAEGRGRGVGEVRQ